MAENLKRSRNPLLLLVLTFLVWLNLFTLISPAKASTEHKVYFKKTDHELHVYEILGDYPGNTLLIIGGMHNEPGGYLSADLYADYSLHQGNLIVVPRANFPVIVSNNRKIHSDMNRKFTNGKGKHNVAEAAEYEEAVVEILKQLMARSNALLNLHDGSGFYRPQYINKMKNPSRWGQCIISDIETYKRPDGHVLNLKERVQSVIDQINPKINNDEHRFHYNNTRTFDQNSSHKEQRGSATYYALTEYGIESYGIETSKNISSLDLKVRYQSMVINAFMNEFQIIPSNPKISIEDPKLEYLLVSVNGSFPYGVPNNKTLYVAPGDKIRIEHIAANYERGLMADIQGLGSLNDLNKDFVIDKPRSIFVKKDQFQCGKIYLAMKKPTVLHVKKVEHTQQPQAIVTTKETAAFFILVNHEEKKVLNGETLEIQPTDTLVLQQFTSPIQYGDKIKVNFVGFVGNKAYNDAEDRGYKIHPKHLWKRHSINKKGELYRVNATLHDDSIAEFFIRIRNR